MGFEPIFSAGERPQTYSLDRNYQIRFEVSKGIVF